MNDDAEVATRPPFSRLTLDDLESLSAKALHLIHTARDAAVQPHKGKSARGDASSRWRRFTVSKRPLVSRHGGRPVKVRW